VVVVAFAFIFLLGWVVTNQAVGLAESIPRYHDEILAKVSRLRWHGNGLGEKIGALGREIKEASGGAHPATQAAQDQPRRSPLAGGAGLDGAGQPAPGTPGNPLYTVPLPAARSPFKTLADYSGLVLGPLGTAALVVVFVIFMLLQREDMRDRMIRLISGGKYMLTTRALNDAAARISRYMLAQSIVNGTYGLVIALGLWLIGLTMGHGITFPNFVLWGLLCAVLRFIPYVGPWVAATFPIAISLAVYPGFGVFVATAVLFIVVELITNNVMEPWLYGASTGMSTVAILVAAVFWTWLWGPVGLLLSTPLSVCIVVLGKYVPQLKFLNVLLGDEPALAPHVSYYQRLLARDRKEAQQLALEYAAEKGSEHVPDDVFIPALILARRDRKESGLSPDDESYIFEETRAILAEIPAPDAAATQNDQAADDAKPLILSVAAHHRSEELVGEMLRKLMSPAGCEVEVIPSRLLPVDVEAMVGKKRPALVFVAVLPPGGLEQARYLVKRLRTRFADQKIVVGYWGRARNFDKLLVRLRAAGASYVTTSLLQSRSQIQALLELELTREKSQQPEGQEAQRAPNPAA
jgi:predicted PurR-regulated permease PerM